MVRHLTPQPDPLLCAALATDLDRADLRSETLRAAWGSEADDALGRGIRGPIVRALAGRTDALATLGRFFVLGMPQPAYDLEAALPSVKLAGIEALGLAYRDGDLAVPAALIRPQSFMDVDGVGEWWIASDLDEVALDGALPPDHVLGVGGATRTLAELVMPIDVGRALDLGTGCGIQALLISRRVGQVVATDVSERALAYAQMNALLGGIRNIEFRHGSMFEPVAEESFDLIVSNPPFVITPRGGDVPEYEYRDGGMEGDALVELFVRDAPAHLLPGGAAQLLGNWESRNGIDGLDRMKSWVAPGIDAWVVERERLSPLGYAELWVRDGGITPRDARFDELLTAWTDDFSARGVDGIGFGYVLLRRPETPTEPFTTSTETAPDAPTLARFEHVSQPLSNPGRAFHAGLTAWDTLTTGLPSTLIVSGDVTEARHHMPGEDNPSVIELRQGGGFGRTVSVDSALAGFVGACDGELTVTQIVSALADILDVPLNDLWAELQPRIRELFFTGMLLPAPH